MSLITSYHLPVDSFGLRLGITATADLKPCAHIKFYCIKSSSTR